MTALEPDNEERRRVVLRALEIEPWVPRPDARFARPAAAGGEAAPSLASEAPTIAPPAASARAAAGGDWAALESEATACTRCSLHQSRTRVVFGVGPRNARWFVVGEAPGADEDRQGEPFVGRAGQLLNEMLLAAGAHRETVYIGNILKCRPPDNRDPRPDEVGHCMGYLQRQIELIAPRLILAVGRIAAQNLLGEEASMGELRGRLHRYGPAGTPVVVTYHPAYLLRSPRQKARAWEDLCLARSVVTPV